MRTRMVLMTALAAGLLAAGCQEGEGPQATTGPAAATKPAPPAPAGLVVLEAESMTLEGCKAADLKGASGGKAIAMMAEGDQATGSVTLKKGTYVVTVFVTGQSPDEDAVYVTVGGGDRKRVFADEHGSLVPATLMGTEETSFEAAVDKDGAVEVKLEFAEKNVQVDRIVLKLKD